MKRVPSLLLLLTVAACSPRDPAVQVPVAGNSPVEPTPAVTVPDPVPAPVQAEPAPAPAPAPAEPVPYPVPPVVAASTATEVTITGVQAYHSSAKVYFAPVPGAKDYRLYDVTNPNDVKYAGLIHLTAAPGCLGYAPMDQASGSSCWQHFATNEDGSLVFPYRATEFSYPNGSHGGPTGYDGPNYVIDFNGLGDGKAHTVVVEAVDALGPVPFMNLYKETDVKAFAPLFPVSQGAGNMVMLGSNKGPTQDGKVSTNGQGPFTNNPKVLATSQPIIVQADRTYSPQIAGASQVFLDRFEDAEGAALVQQPGDCENYTNDRGDWGGREWTLNAGTDKAWRIIARQNNCSETMPFVMGSHFMEVLSDRQSTIYSSHAMTPERSFQLNGGILHLTQMFDDVQSGGRWTNFAVAPAGDPLQHWNHQDSALNNGNQWLFMETFRDDSHFLISDGPAVGNPRQHGDWAEPWGASRADMYDARIYSPNGHGFDNKRRWDFFLSATHAALFIDGRLVAQGPVPTDKGAWLNGALKIYFTDYLYHSEAGQKQMLTNRITNPQGDCNIPMMAFWFNDVELGTRAGSQVMTMLNGVRMPANGYGNNICRQDTPPGFGFPRTQEWHRDDMGASVIPANLTSPDDFSSLAALVQPPKIVAPKISDVPVPKAAPTGSSMPMSMHMNMSM